MHARKVATGVIGLEEGFMFQAESKEHVAWLQFKAASCESYVEAE